MSRLTIAGAACALWLAAGSAAADPFAGFMDLCMATNLDRQAAGTAAKAKGWVLLPAEDMDLEDEAMSDLALYSSIDPLAATEKTSVDELTFLLTAVLPSGEFFDVPGVRMEACAVMSSSGDADALVDRMGEHLGIGRVRLSGDDEVWIFSRQGSGFRSAADLMTLDEAELPRIAREQKIYIVGVITEDDMSGLILAAIRPDN